VTALDPLQQLLASASGSAEPEVDALEQFVAEQLAAAGEWKSARTSDGISFHRIVERGPHRVVVTGEIWSIDDRGMDLHPFWLVVESDTWTLFFDVDTSLVSARRAGWATHLDHPGQLPWRVTITR
jgi:hypothetical protein